MLKMRVRYETGAAELLLKGTLEEISEILDMLREREKKFQVEGDIE